MSRYAEASGADDVDLVLCRTGDVLHAMIAAARREESNARLVDLLQADALALCVWPATTSADADGARPTILILWRTLRRRRPLVAAMLRAKLSHDRAMRRDPSLRSSVPY